VTHTTCEAWHGKCCSVRGSDAECGSGREWGSLHEDPPVALVQAVIFTSVRSQEPCCHVGEEPDANCADRTTAAMRMSSLSPDSMSPSADMRSWQEGREVGP
jgi:hypothetical protein